MVRKSKSDQFAHGSFYAMIMIALISSLSSKMPTTVLIESDEILYVIHWLGGSYWEILCQRFWLWPEFTVFTKYSMTY